MFDFGNKAILSDKEGMLLYKSLIIGYMRLTGCFVPTTENVKNAARIVS